MEVTYKTQGKTLPLLVVAGEGPSLIGRNRLTELKLGWHELHQMYQRKDLQTILNSHKAVFKEELGKAVELQLHYTWVMMLPHVFAGPDRFLML